MSRYRMNVAFTLEAPVETSDGAGGQALAWTPLGRLWGSFKSVRGRAGALAGASIARNTADIVLRASAPGATSRPEPRQRLSMGTRVFIIDAVHEADATGHYLICRAREETAQ